MITVNTARELIASLPLPKREINLPVDKAVDHVLSRPVISPVDTPGFHQSAMDGYAFRFSDLTENASLRIIGEVQAGGYSKQLPDGPCAIRIFTGAAVPEWCDTVVMQEKTHTAGDQLFITDEALNRGANIRLKGSQCHAGDEVLQAGQYVNAPTVSFLSMLGITSLSVWNKPRINILVTGKELVKPGQALPEGSVYESNSFGLLAALRQMHLEPDEVTWSDDTMEEIRHHISRMMDADILLITGGVSVGDYDYVVPALESLGVNRVFHKIKQKPGKPFYVGTSEKGIVFAVPGNPASVMTCFYEYIAPLLSPQHSMVIPRVPLLGEYMKKPGLTHFLKAWFDGYGVSVLPKQESYLMDTFARANCLVEVPEETEHLPQGSLVRIRLIQ